MIHDHSHHAPRSATKTFAIGLVHGLAGSTALTLAVAASLQSTLDGLLYIAIFGLGSIGGMLLMSTVMSLPFAFCARQLAGIQRPAQGLIGMVAVSFGLYFAWNIGMS